MHEKYIKDNDVKKLFIIFTIMTMGICSLLAEDITISKQIAYILEGKIDKKPITMFLTLGEEIEDKFGDYYYYGSYYCYNESKIPLSIQAQPKGDKVISRVYKNDDYRNILETFTGDFDKKNGTYKGVWEGGGKKYNFSLSRKNDIPASKATKYSIKFYDAKKVEFTNDEGEKDEMTFDIEYTKEFIWIDNPKQSSAIDKINRDIDAYAYFDSEKDLVSYRKKEALDYLTDFKNSGEAHNLHEYVSETIDIDYIDEKIISFSLTSYDRGFGTDGWASVYSLETGESINDISLLLKNVNDSKLLSLMRKKLLEDDFEKDSYRDFNKVRLTDQFNVVSGGFTFFFSNDYFMAPPNFYSVIEFTFDELRPFVKDDSPFKYLFDR